MNVRARVSTSILLGVGMLSAPAFAQAQPDSVTPLPGDVAATPPTTTTEPPTPPPAPSAPATTLSAVKIESPSTTIKFGLLMQPQFEMLGDVNRDSYANNLFLRRARILVGGTLFGVVDYFLDTDYPNLFKATGAAPVMMVNSPSLKGTPGMNIQDAFLTYKPMADVVKVDVGYMLPPLSHNAVQGAATLYGLDYFQYSFRNNLSFGASASPVGRDLGVQLRGLLMDGHIEYRAGLFQGLRNPQTATAQGASNFFRASGRVQINLLDAETGFFYAGTYLGAKKILSVGGSFDFQDNYKYFAGDVLLDLPVGPGVVTAQINVAHLDGGTFIPALVNQTVIMGEAGFNITALNLAPSFRYEQLIGSGALANQKRIGGGLALWQFGHNSNLKAFYTRVMETGAAHGANQANLQWQVYFF